MGAIQSSMNNMISSVGSLSKGVAKPTPKMDTMPVKDVKMAQLKVKLRQEIYNEQAKRMREAKARKRGGANGR